MFFPGTANEEDVTKLFLKQRTVEVDARFEHMSFGEVKERARKERMVVDDEDGTLLDDLTERMVVDDAVRHGGGGKARGAEKKTKKNEKSKEAISGAFQKLTLDCGELKNEMKNRIRRIVRVISQEVKQTLLKKIGLHLAEKCERTILSFPWRCVVAVVGSAGLALGTDHHTTQLPTPAHSFP